MLVPGIPPISSTDPVAATRQLHKAHSALHETPRHETLPRIFGLMLVAAIHAIELFGRFTFFADVGEFRHGFLHEIGGLGIFHRSHHGIFGRRSFGKLPVQSSDEIKRATLL